MTDIGDYRQVDKISESENKYLLWFAFSYILQ
jgi:hypothetical protein